MHIRQGVNAVLIASALYLLWKSYRNKPTNSGVDVSRAFDHNDDCLHYATASMSAIGILLWPVLWDVTIGYAMLRKHPFMVFGFLWPIILMLMDLNTARRKTKKKDESGKVKVTDVEGDARSLVTIAFAMGTLLTSQAYMDKEGSKLPSHILMYALLMCMAFVFPLSSTLDPKEECVEYLQSGQRVFLNYAIGFIIGGIALNLSIGRKKNMK